MASERAICHCASAGPEPVSQAEKRAPPSFQRLTWGLQLEAWRWVTGSGCLSRFPGWGTECRWHCCLACGELGAASGFLLGRGMVHR